MSNSKSTSDKPFALRVSIICAAIIAIVYVLLGSFTHQVAGNFHKPVYVIGVFVLAFLFIAASLWAYKMADDDTYDNLSRGVVIGLTIGIIVWACSWVAGSNEKKMMGDDIKKAKQACITTYTYKGESL